MCAAIFYITQRKPPITISMLAPKCDAKANASSALLAIYRASLSC